MRGHIKKVLLFGRFNLILRAFTSFVAGTSKIKIYKFFILSIIGSILWAILYTLIGYIFGYGYDIAAKYFGRFLGAGILLGIILVISYKIINKRRYIFTKYHAHILTVNLICLYLLSKMIDDVIGKEFVTKIDIWMNAKMVLLWNPLLNKLMILITSLMTPFGLAMLSAGLLCFLIYKKRWYYSFLLIFSVGGGALFEFLLKLIIHRARPENALISVSGYSFPSGHATLAIIFFSLLLYSFVGDIKNKVARVAFIAANITLFLLIGFSRIYLNVHWFSDVVAGFALGLFWLTLLILILKVIKPNYEEYLPSKLYSKFSRKPLLTK
jgi:undecaprenyl-diphosphatase